MSPSQPAPEALVVCPVCGAAVPGPDYDQHLRRLHELVSYRGFRQSVPDTLDAIRADLLADPPSDVAWQAIARLAREEHGDPLPWLAGWLAAVVQKLPERRRAELFPALAALLAPGNEALVGLLAERPEPAARRLALEAVALASPLPPGLVRPARLLLHDREADEGLQARVVANTLADPASEKLAARMLRWFASGRSREAAIRRLRNLTTRVGPHPLIEAAVARLLGKLRLPCPRCGIDLAGSDLGRHLWDAHRLLLEGETARDPWEVIEGWADQYRARRDPRWLERCRVAAAKVDPEAGPARLERLLLARGLGDLAARQAILARAAEEHAGCCPWCYGLVPIPRETPPLEVNLRPGRLSAGGYEVESDERGVRTWVRAVSPHRVEYEGTEPGQPYTPWGAVLLSAGPLVGLALLTALLWPWPPLPAVFFLLTLAGLVGLFAWLLTRFERPSAERLFDQAWGLLAPRLYADGYDPSDSRFLAGLARLASRRDRTDVPDAPLRAALHVTLEALELRRAPPGHLAALCRLSAEVMAARGGDPVALVERWVALAFEGRVPLAFAQHLFDRWRADFWSAGQLTRLRLRVLDRAFEAGFEVQGLLDAGQNAPALGAVLRVDAPDGLAALRLVWSLRASRPWDRLGDVRTAFELASEPALTDLLEAYPDVLLWQREGTLVARNGAEYAPAEVQLTLAGVWVADELFAIPPRLFEVQERSRGHELLVGGALFRTPGDPERLTRVLERWFRYAFHDFLPQVPAVREWVSPSRAALLRAWGAVACPECGRHLLPRVGEVGVALEEAKGK